MIVIPFASLIILPLTPWLSFPFVQFWDITWSLLAMSSATLFFFWKTRNNGLFLTKGTVIILEKVWGKLCVNCIPKSTKYIYRRTEESFGNLTVAQRVDSAVNQIQYITTQLIWPCRTGVIFLWFRASEGMHKARSVKKIMPVCTSLFISPVKNLIRSLRIFKDLWRSAKTCKRPLKMRTFERSQKIFT